jgi:hypothetical protein
MGGVSEREIQGVRKDQNDYTKKVSYQTRRVWSSGVPKDEGLRCTCE